MQGLIPSFMTCRRSGREKGDGPHRMGKGFLSRMILRCLMKKSGTIIWQYAMSLQIFLAKGKSLYGFRWPIEVSYYEQKTFWSLCSYMVRSRKGIEMLINLINIAYCAMKILPYQDKAFLKYQTESVQEFRFALSEQIRQQVFYAIFVEKVETSIKSNALITALNSWFSNRGIIYKVVK